MNKQTIEVLENIIRSLYKEDWRVPKPAKMKIDALSQAIQWGKSLESAEGELEYQKEQYRLVAKENKFLHTCYVVKNYEQLQQENAKLREDLNTLKGM